MNTTLPEADLVRQWELHTQLEFATKDASATVATMTTDNYVNHVPVMTGGRRRDEMIELYGKHFIPKMPADTSLRLIARTVGKDRLIGEFVFSFTHDIEMDWMKSAADNRFRKYPPQPVVKCVGFENKKESDDSN
jgi:carboxymethylenebutenolidase